jgi:hypothetical protein
MTDHDSLRENAPVDEERLTSNSAPAEQTSADDSSLDPVQEADEESFPASDAPAWIRVHPGPPAT